MQKTEEFRQLHNDAIKFIETSVLSTDSARELFRLEREYFEIGCYGEWVASTAKRGHDILQARHFDPMKKRFLQFFRSQSPPPFAWEAYLAQKTPAYFWQSDGAPPHFIQCSFERLVQIRQIALYLDFPTDQSYTPIRIQVHWGLSSYPLFTLDDDDTQKFVVETPEPTGWICLMRESMRRSGNSVDEPTVLYARRITIVITENHSGGDNTRIRQVRIYSDQNSKE